MTASEASTQAQQLGEPVDITSQTTETSDVQAEPDGSFQLTSSLTPVRVQQNGAWVAIDTTLHVAPDGTLRPAAAADDVAFSDGGSAPLVQLSNGDDSIGFTWPSQLPQPTISGDSATYASVLPGVDLMVQASADSFSDVLVVHNAAAAADPALANLKLTATATGVNLATDSTGGLIGTDSATGEEFHGSPPVMWDSSRSAQDGETPTADNPGGADVTTIPLSMPAADGETASTDTATSTLTLQPPATAVNGTAVTYPIFIDPSLSPTRTSFAVVLSNGAPYYSDTKGDLETGYCGWSGCDGIGTARTYLSFDTSDLTGQATKATVYSADVQVYNIHSAHGCTAEPVDLYSASSISGSTIWPGPQGSKLDEENSSKGDNCSTTPAGTVDFNSGVTGYAQTAANNGTSTLNFELRAPDEAATTNNAYEWKRFSSLPSGGSAAQLVVAYAFPPSVPSGLHISNSVACPGHAVWTRDPTPTLWAQAKDNNPSPEQVALYFHEKNDAGTEVAASGGVVVPSNVQGSWTSTKTLADSSYSYTVQATSDSPNTANPAGGTSSAFSFSVITAKLPTPVVSSYQYPPGTWGAPAGAGSFSFSGTRAAGFSYAFDTAGGENALTDTTCNYTTTPTNQGGTVTATSEAATITPPSTLTVGYHTLYVKSFDGAHNISDETAGYTFYVAPTLVNEGPVLHEAENYTVTPTAGVTGYNYNEAGSVWSGNAEKHLVSDGGVSEGNPISPANPIDFNYAFTTPFDGDYVLGMQLTGQNHFGILQFKVDGTLVYATAAGSVLQVDTYRASAATFYQTLGGQHLTAGSHVLTVEIVGTSGINYQYNYGTYGDGTAGGTATIPVGYNDNGYSAGFDYFEAVPLKAGPFSNLASAMNNNAIAYDGSTGADLNNGPVKYGLSETTLQSAGFGSGQTKTVTFSDNPNGTTFSMPVVQAGKADNVIADGQTINLPAAVAAKMVDLLVVSSCHDTVAQPGLRLTTNLDSGSFPSYALSTVPDVTTGTPPANDPSPPTTARTVLVATLPYLDTGSTATKYAHSAYLYIVRIPLDNHDNPGKVSSVVLPSVNSAFTCATPALHVFAISTES